MTDLELRNFTMNRTLRSATGASRAEFSAENYACSANNEVSQFSKNMIITKLQGGLGNQLFQYAAGMSAAQSLGVPLKLDIEFYKKYGHKRQYGLDNFAISSEIATASEIKKIKNETILNKIKREIFSWKNKNIIIESNHQKFYSEISNIRDNAYLDGFWASEKYFKGIESVIRKEFALINPLPDKINPLLEAIGRNNSVSIHIRRGDYMAPRYKKIFSECGLEYYRSAISLISEKIPDPHFFVFSDDIKWTKENLTISDPTTFVSQGCTRDYEEIIIMSKCKNNIIANSTFGWWGAWLNENPEKIAIAPKKWFADETANDNDLIPEKWIRL